MCCIRLNWYNVMHGIRHTLAHIHSVPTNLPSTFDILCFFISVNFSLASTGPTQSTFNMHCMHTAQPPTNQRTHSHIKSNNSPYSFTAFPLALLIFSTDSFYILLLAIILGPVIISFTSSVARFARYWSFYRFPLLLLLRPLHTRPLSLSHSLHLCTFRSV